MDLEVADTPAGCAVHDPRVSVVLTTLAPKFSNVPAEFEARLPFFRKTPKPAPSFERGSSQKGRAFSSANSLHPTLTIV